VRFRPVPLGITSARQHIGFCYAAIAHMLRTTVHSVSFLLNMGQGRESPASENFGTGSP
jgi:hypothetical protein